MCAKLADRPARGRCLNGKPVQLNRKIKIRIIPITKLGMAFQALDLPSGSDQLAFLHGRMCEEQSARFPELLAETKAR